MEMFRAKLKLMRRLTQQSSVVIED